MNDIIIAVIGALSTILTAAVTGLFAQKEISQRDTLINTNPPSAEEQQNLRSSRKILFWKIFSITAFLVGIIFTVSVILIKKEWEIKNVVDKDLAQLQQLVVKKVEKAGGNPYIIPNILMYVNLEKVTDSTSTHLEADVTFVYNLIYDANINMGKKKDDLAFNEFWSCNRGDTLVKFNGSDREVIFGTSTENKKWNIIYPATIGDYRTTITHFKSVYPEKLKKYDSKFFGNIEDNEEEFAYPNYDNDIIGKIVIMVSSSTLNLKLADSNNAAVGSLNDLHPRDWVDPLLFTSFSGGKLHSTIVARFDEIQEHDVAKLKVQW